MACTNLKVFETPYNYDPDVQPRSGIMFDVKALNRPVTIDTIQMDVRNGEVVPLNVDIYATDSQVNKVYKDKSAWSLVARTKFERDPIGGDTYIVPAWHFVPVKIESGQKKGFYIRMKASYIDNTVSGSPENEPVIGSDLAVFTGYYVDISDPDKEFPSAVGIGDFPVFAGKFHYELSESCSLKSYSTTKSEFIVIMDSGQVDFGKIVQITYDTISNLLTVDADLKSFVQNDALIIKRISDEGVVTEVQDYAGDCPRGWQKCLSLVTTVTFEHDEELPSGDVQNRIYLYYKQISQAQMQILPKETRAAYAGLTDTKAEFRMMMDGVSEKLKMDEEQMKFLQNQIVLFLNAKMRKDRAQAFKTTITDQSLFDIDSIEMYGTVNGGIVVPQTDADFAKYVKDRFDEFKGDFFDILKYNLGIPGPMTQNERYKYFNGASDFSITVQVEKLTKAPTPSPTFQEDLIDKHVTLGLDAAGNIDNRVWVGAGVGAGLTVLLTIICCCHRRIKKYRKKAAAKRERREERARLKAAMNGDPSAAAETVSDAEGKGSSEGENPESDGNDNGKPGTSNTSKRSLFSRDGSQTTNRNNSERFVDEDDSSVSSGEYNQSSLLPTAGGGRGKLMAEFMRQGSSRRSAGAFDDGLDDDNAVDSHRNEGFDPFTGKVKTANEGVQQKQGDGNSQQQSGFSFLMDIVSPKKPKRQRSKKGLNESDASLRSGMDETPSHASERALSKVRDLEMQALNQSGSLSSELDGDNSFQKGFGKTESSTSILSGISEASSKKDKKKKKEKKKKKDKDKDDDDGDDDDDDSSEKRRKKEKKRLKKLERSFSERSEASGTEASDDFSDHLSSASSKQKKKKKKHKEKKSSLTDLPEETFGEIS